MKKIMCLLSVLSLTGCGDSNNSGYTNGTFKATMGEINIDVAVTCGNFNSDDAFFFNSDKMGIKDVDGDGVIVNASRVITDVKIGSTTKSMDIMSLNISVNGENYIPPLSGSGLDKDKWTKTSNSFFGSDVFTKEDDVNGTKYPITYKAVCN